MANDYDVIVVGSGAAGLAASIAAAEAGASVLLVDADTRVGGSSRLSGGHFYAADTSIQRKAGVTDSADAMFEHYMTLNQWMVEPSVVRRYCDLSGPTFEWALEHGAPYIDDGLYPSGVGSTPRGHRADGDGEAIVNAFDAHRARLGVDVVLDAHVDELLVDSAGAVNGIRIGADLASSGAVVLATGGFGANREMLARYYPDAAKADNWAWYIGTPHAQGDGLKMGQAIGAAIDGHNRGLLLVTPGFSKDLEVWIPGWLILVNSEGRRFTSESAPYTVLGGLIQKQGGHAFAVFDEEARADAKPSDLSRAYWVNEILEAKADEGRIYRADSIEALAQAIGAPAATLAGTIARYNADCETGEDTAFFKPPESGMRPIVTPPFYAVEVRPAIVCWTGTGLRIDSNTQVLRTDESPVAGLYAAGEIVGSLHGDRYIGGGGSFGPCIVFGKLAGERAAAHALAHR